MEFHDSISFLPKAGTNIQHNMTICTNYKLF